MRKTTQGFSLVEIMIVIAITGLLITIVVFNVQPAGQKSRDAQRQADLRQVQTALEQYKNRHGRYPEGCNGVTTLDTNANPVPSSNINWSGEFDAEDRCGDSDTPYILGAPGRLFSQFLQPLPTDPKLNGDDSGYRYTTNEDGTVYKFMVKNTVEADDLSYEHPFKSCDVSYNFEADRGTPSLMQDKVRACDPPGITDYTNPSVGCDIALCDRLYNTNQYAGANNIPPSHCREDNVQFESSYAVWGGVSHITTNSAFILGNAERTRVHIERQTENIICRLP